MISQRSICSAENDVPNKASRARDERGVALLIALLLVMLVSALSIGMYIAMSSDSLINGFYRNQRSSYYAADTGIAIGRQYLMNQLVANENTSTFSRGNSTAWHHDSHDGSNSTHFQLRKLLLSR